MSVRGKPSEAHTYDKNDECIFCHLTKKTITQLTHECTPQRELVIDSEQATNLKLNIVNYRRGEHLREVIREKIEEVKQSLTGVKKDGK